VSAPGWLMPPPLGNQGRFFILEIREVWRAVFHPIQKNGGAFGKILRFDQVADLLLDLRGAVIVSFQHPQFCIVIKSRNVTRPHIPPIDRPA
jgi:hypothetical protein